MEGMLFYYYDLIVIYIINTNINLILFNSN